MSNPVQIDLTDVDIRVRATTRGGTRRANLTSGTTPLNLTGVASFDGEVLPDEDATIGTGTAITWPVIDDVGGGISIVIPADLDLGDQWVYVEATVAGDTVAISGRLTITRF